MRRLATAAAAAAILATASSAVDAASVTDARGRTVDVSDRSRVVSIGGTVTEILYALGVEGSIVAVDTTSLYPPQALKDHPNVGYMRALSAEGVLSTNPSLILASEMAGPPEVADLLAGSSVPMAFVDDTPSHAAVTERIRFVAAAMDVPEKGEALAGRVEDGFARLEAARAQVKTPARVLFVLSVRDGHPLVAGSGTAADAIIGLAGGTNIAAGFEGYKAMGDEAIIEAQPDVIVVMANGDHKPDAGFLDMPAFAATPAGKDKRLIVMDGQSLLGFGPRTPEVALDLARTLHPGQVQ